MAIFVRICWFFVERCITKKAIRIKYKLGLFYFINQHYPFFARGIYFLHKRIFETRAKFRKLGQIYISRNAITLLGSISGSSVLAVKSSISRKFRAPIPSTSSISLFWCSTCFISMSRISCSRKKLGRFIAQPEVKKEGGRFGNGVKNKLIKAQHRAKKRGHFKALREK